MRPIKNKPVFTSLPIPQCGLWIWRGVLFSFCILRSALCISESAEALKLVQTIPLPGVKGRFDHFSIDAKGNRLFVAALGNNTVEVIDLTAGKRSRSITGMSKPQGVLFIAERNELAVAGGDDGTLRILDAGTFAIKQKLTEMPDADNVRLDPHTGETWVGYGDGALARVLPGVHVGTIKVTGHPESFQLEKQGRRIFANVPDAKQIAVIDTGKDSVVATWPMEKFHANFPMALDEPNHRLFVGCRRPARLVVLDTDNGKPVADLAICGDTDDLFYDARRKRIYISGGEEFIDVISQDSADAYSRLARIQTSSGARTCYFSGDLDRLYLAVPERGKQEAEIRVYQPE
jgi:YVTN family beta-propeller protein